MVLLVFIQVLSRHGNAPSETSTKAETNIENTELNSHNRINLGDSLQDKRIYFKFGMLIFGYVIAKYSMRRGVAPSPFPTAGTTFPLDTFLFNASLFSFSRGVAYSMASLHVSPRIYCRAQASLWLALHRSKCFRCALDLPLIGFSSIVTTRETECAACHESNAAGSPSDGRSGYRGPWGTPPMWGSQKGQSPV